MKTSDPTNPINLNNTLPIIGAVLLIPNLLFWCLQFQRILESSVIAPTHSTAQSLLDFFPRMMDYDHANIIILLLTSIAAIVVSAIRLKRAKSFYKIIGTLVICIAILGSAFPLIMFAYSLFG